MYQVQQYPEADVRYAADSKGIINARIRRVCRMLAGNEALAVQAFEPPSRSFYRFQRQSLIEQPGTFSPRFTTRIKGSLYDPVGDAHLLQMSLQYRDFFRALRDHSRFFPIFDRTYSWDERARMQNVLSYTEAQFTCQISSRKNVHLEWSQIDLKDATMRIYDLPAPVVRNLRSERVALSCTLPNGTFIKCYGYVSELDQDDDTLHFVSDEPTWRPEIRNQCVTVEFAPNRSRHALLATAAIEGVAIMVDSLNMIPIDVFQDQTCFVVNYGAVHRMEQGLELDSDECTDEQRQAAKLMLACGPAKTVSIVTGPKRSGKTRSVWLALRIMMRLHLPEKHIQYFVAVRDNQAGCNLVERLLSGVLGGYYAENLIFLIHNVTQEEFESMPLMVQGVSRRLVTAVERGRIPLWIATCDTFLRLAENESIVRRPPDVVIFDGVMGVNPLNIVGTVFAQGQPSRIVFVLDTETPSPIAFETCDETRCIRFGLRDIVESFLHVFQEDMLTCIKPEFGVNLSRKFGVSPTHTEVNNRLYHPMLRVEQTKPFHIDFLAQENDQLTRRIFDYTFNTVSTSFVTVVTTNDLQACDMEVMLHRTYHNHIEADVVVHIVKSLVSNNPEGNLAGGTRNFVAVTSVFHGQVQELRQKYALAVNNWHHGVPIVDHTELTSLNTSILVVSLVRGGTPLGTEYPDRPSSLARKKEVRALLLSVPANLLVLVGSQEHLDDVWQSELTIADRVTAGLLMSNTRVQE